MLCCTEGLFPEGQAGACVWSALCSVGSALGQVRLAGQERTSSVLVATQDVKEKQ